ncbi:MAG: UDP-N-acetylmuramate dehydrogenase, partial [Oscillospiraceae bacterium]
MLWYEQLDEKVAAYLPDLRIERDVPMSRYTSFHVGGAARRMAFPATRAQVVLLLAMAEETGARTLLLGNGTNLLAADEGLDRLVINLSASLKAMELREGNCIEAEAGVSLRQLAEFAWQNGLTGLEFAHGIPGSLGGGVCMNAGAYGGELGQVVTRAVAVYPDGVRTLSGEDLHLSYRHSVFSDSDGVVLAATVGLTPGDRDAIRAKMEELAARRKASQPLDFPSAGSTFKRPEGYFAGKLIDDCGLRGTTIGGAQVSEKHGGFVINRGGATCGDVVALIALVQKTVFEKTGIQLEPEVKIVKD